jgi:membrane-associated HD superfamily phosphohydrolase
VIARRLLRSRLGNRTPDGGHWSAPTLHGDAVTSTARPLLLQRLASALLAVVVVPLMVGVAAIADEQPFPEGEPAPRTVFATQQVRVVDEAATDTARRTAAESVEPVLVFDRAAQSAIVNDLGEVFDDVRAVREPVEVPNADEEPATLRPPAPLRAARGARTRAVGPR